MTARRPFDLVIFDNDGVLVDSEWHANGILAEALSGLGVPATRETCIAEYMGRSLPDVRARVERQLGRPLPVDFERRYHERLFEMFRTRLTPIPGVADALARITTPVCVASSGGRERIRLALAVTGLLARFEGRIFSADDVARGKPAPDLYLHAARTLGAEPARCAVVEDSPLGVEAAAAAGMTVFAFARTTPAERLATADAVFTSMEELPPLVEQPPAAGNDQRRTTRRAFSS